MLAASAGLWDLCEWFINRECDVNHKAFDEQTVVHVLVANRCNDQSYFKIWDLLIIKSYVSYNSLNVFGETCLHLVQFLIMTFQFIRLVCTETWS